MRTGAEEARSPKYRHLERERRFLIDARRLPDLPGEHVLIEDRYMGDTRFRLRRMTGSATGLVAHKLAKKYDCADPLARPMVNAYLDGGEYRIFAALPARTITKRRYAVADGSWTFSVDVFAGLLTGLVLAEIEAATADDLNAVLQPAWARREVSFDPRFQGGALAMLDAPPTEYLS